MVNNTRGYFFIALGRYYIDECVLLSETIRQQWDELPISLLINIEDKEYAQNKNVFDQLIVFNPSGDEWHSRFFTNKSDIVERESKIIRAMQNVNGLKFEGWA